MTREHIIEALNNLRQDRGSLDELTNSDLVDAILALENYGTDLHPVDKDQIIEQKDEISCEKCALFQRWNPEQKERESAEEILKTKTFYPGYSSEIIEAMIEYAQSRQPEKVDDARSIIIQFLSESTWIKLPERKDCIDVADEWLRDHPEQFKPQNKKI
jgi:hypothetical protein